MHASSLHKRYAEALFRLSIKKNILRAIMQDMESLAQLYKRFPSLQELLAHPLYRSSQKIALLTKVTKSLHTTTLHFLQLLIKKKRIAHLYTIIKSFFKCYQLHERIATTHLTTAVPITIQLRAKLLALLQSQDKSYTYQLIEHTDPTLLGGYILRTADKQVDGSIRSQLKQLEHHWTKDLL